MTSCQKIKKGKRKQVKEEEFKHIQNKKIFFDEADK